MMDPASPVSVADTRPNLSQRSLHCDNCGIRTHKGASFLKLEALNNDVYYGVCVACNPDKVPAEVRHEWEEKQIAQGKPIDRPAPQTRRTSSSRGMTSPGSSTKGLSSSSRGVTSPASSVRKAWKEKHRDSAGAPASPAVVLDNMSSELSFKDESELSSDPSPKAKQPKPPMAEQPKRQPSATKKSPSKRPESKRSPSVEFAKTPPSSARALNTSSSSESHTLERSSSQRLLHCDECGLRTATGTSFLKVDITSEDVYKGICIKCHPNEVPAPVYEAWQKTEKERKEREGMPKMTRSQSRRLHCDMCGSREYTGTSFLKVPVTNDQIFEGSCIPCNFDKMPKEVQDAWVEKNGEPPKVVPKIVPMVEASAKKAKTPTTPPATTKKNKSPVVTPPPVAMVDPTRTPTSKQSDFLDRTFEIPPVVTTWLEQHFRGDDVGAVVLAGASGKSINNFVKDKSRSSSSRRSCSRRRADDTSPEELEAMRKELADLKNEMEAVKSVVESSAETDPETDWGS